MFIGERQAVEHVQNATLPVGETLKSAGALRLWRFEALKSLKPGVSQNPGHSRRCPGGGGKAGLAQGQGRIIHF